MHYCWLHKSINIVNFWMVSCSRSPVHRDARHSSRRASHDNKRARRDSSDALKKQRKYDTKSACTRSNNTWKVTTPHNNLNRDVPSSARTAKKTSPVSKTDSGYGDDRWCPSNNSPDVFSSLVVTPKVDVDAEAANEKRRKLKVLYGLVGVALAQK